MRRWALFLIGLAVTGQQATPPALTPAKQFEEERLEQLMKVRRIYVDILIGSGAEQIRDMLMASLQGAQIFIVTENAEKADAILRGSAVDLIYNNTFQSNDSANSRGSVDRGTGAGKTRKGNYSGITAGEHESSHISERRHEASVALRLVNKQGDVIWSTTQESQGAKFRSSSADAADKVMKQLLLDYDRARKAKAVAKPAVVSQP